MVVVILPITDQVASGADMLELNNCLSGDFLALGHQVLGRLVDALDYPVVTFIALAIISEARHLILPSQRRGNIVRMQIPAGLRVLQPDYLLAGDGLAGRAQFILLRRLHLQKFALLYTPQ